MSAGVKAGFRKEPRKDIFMVLLKKGQKLDEMTIQVVSSRTDGLPFRIAIKAPDHQPPHAHVMDLETGTFEVGQFLLSDNQPGKPEDIKNYKQGIDDAMRQTIFDWAKAPHKALPKITNWDALILEWGRNEKW
jgi:hypothetical protein